MRKCSNCGTRQDATNGPKCCNHPGREVAFPMDFPPDPIAPLQAEIDHLTAERDQYHEAAHRHRGEVQRLLHDAIEPLKAERDTALARAAAAAMEMREAAIERCVNILTETGIAGGIPDDPLTGLVREDILALPIDPDAQKVLDGLLAKARVDAIRDAADIVNKNRDISGWVSHDAILALLNDGGRDE